MDLFFLEERESLFSQKYEVWESWLKRKYDGEIQNYRGNVFMIILKMNGNSSMFSEMEQLLLSFWKDDFIVMNWIMNSIWIWEDWFGRGLGEYDIHDELFDEKMI